MERIITVIITVTCLAGFSPAVHACFCIIPEVPEALESANAVFLGEVTDISEPSTSVPVQFLVIKFKVLRSWKGVAFGGR